MLFSSLLFIYGFLPLVLMLHYFLPKKHRNKLLLAASLLFFAWGGVSYSFILIFSLLVNYLIGIQIDQHRGTVLAKRYLLLGISLNLANLILFKYAGFLTWNLNWILLQLGLSTINIPNILLPLGISFYTFQAMSYLIDLYRNEAQVQKNFFRLSLYISFFPQLIAGPIVRYQHLARQLTNRVNHLTGFSYGIQRFSLGLAKKVLIANPMGFVADQAFSIPAAELNSVTAWIGILAYTFQIYFDFSGYSDMAIGLGRMFGFKLPENFNFPYMARSVREFWQRWHITLSDWFKNYLYFPLGGSRKSSARVILNLLIVFFATSIWHGASWNFVIWGMTHGIFMMLERLGWGRILDRLWRPIQHFYALFIIVVTRVFFRAEGFENAWTYFLELFRFNFSNVHITVLPHVTTNYFFVLTLVAILSATPFWLNLGRRLQSLSLHNRWQGHPYAIRLQSISFVLLALSGLAFSTVLLVGDTYNPFIYFRF